MTKSLSHQQGPKTKPLIDLKNSIAQEQLAIREILLGLKRSMRPQQFLKYEHLLAHITECTCHKYQSDGVPCENNEANCLECEKALKELADLRKSLNSDLSESKG